MSTLRTIRAFSVELMKIASGVKDADIQKLLAERKGQEYLDGGRLLTNTEPEATYFMKMSAGGYSAPLGMGATGNYDLKAHRKKNNHYQKARDYGATAVKGGLTGLGLLGAHNAMRGRFGSPEAGVATLRAAKAARSAAAIGASAAVADRAYRYDELNKSAMVAENPSAGFKSPASGLANSSQTGSFRPGVIHNTGKAPASFQIGQKFRIP